MRGVTSSFALAWLTACADPAPPPDLPRAMPGWTVSRDAPVIAAGSLRAMGLWNDPSLLRTADGYVLYMTTSTGAPFAPPVLPFRAVSRDGAHWTLSPDTPLLSPAGGPYASIETPSVARFAGRYWMAFTGVYADPDPSPMAIGLAVSVDGIDWRIARWTLLKATGGARDWNGYLVAEPGLAVRGDEMLLYFSAVGAREGGGPPLQSIGLVRSRDGVTFSPPTQVLTQGPLYPAAQGYAGYASPAALAEADGVDLFYSVAHEQKGADPAWQQVAIHHARSADGVHFQEDPAPLLTRASTQWTDGEILAPGPLRDSDRIKLWFGGHVARSRLGPLIQRGVAGPEFGIGLATLPLDQFMPTKTKGTDR
ncbi:hypothetical protein [Sphingobium sp. HWE2-09]|uniref:hypothetical protein n=1 Tax=Sphingobium sp. HWE2-09 TaxID=3108390 RepID=UPI002DC94669|nr:hypothetical protein [Sphingobium sp. HWE2-09]